MEKEKETEIKKNGESISYQANALNEYEKIVDISNNILEKYKDTDSLDFNGIFVLFYAEKKLDNMLKEYPDAVFYKNADAIHDRLSLICADYRDSDIRVSQYPRNTGKKGAKALFGNSYRLSIVKYRFNKFMFNFFKIVKWYAPALTLGTLLINVVCPLFINGTRVARIGIGAFFEEQLAIWWHVFGQFATLGVIGSIIGATLRTFYELHSRDGDTSEREFYVHGDIKRYISYISKKAEFVLAIDPDHIGTVEALKNLVSEFICMEEVIGEEKILTGDFGLADQGFR